MASPCWQQRLRVILWPPSSSITCSFFCLVTCLMMFLAYVLASSSESDLRASEKSPVPSCFAASCATILTCCSFVSSPSSPFSCFLFFFFFFLWLAALMSVPAFCLVCEGYRGSLVAMHRPQEGLVGRSLLVCAWISVCDSPSVFPLFILVFHLCGCQVSEKAPVIQTYIYVHTYIHII